MASKQGNKQQSARSKKDPAHGRGGGGEEKRDQKLQAILMADSFSKTFHPLSWDMPKVLFPLVNVPMLEYTVEFLAQNGVEEIFIVCVSHADQIEEYVNVRKAGNWPENISVHCVRMSCLSAGDALRELDTRNLVRSDPFILISGDVVSNMDLKRAMAFHSERRKADSSAILTVVLKPVQKGAGSKPVLDDLVVALDKNTSQIVLFADKLKHSNARIPLEVLTDHPSLVLRTDLLDTHIDICSPELMLQFSDNFDYLDIRRDFIENEVINTELGMHIYGYILNSLPPLGLREYAARVQDPRTYHSICRDIVTRWVYPFVPDNGLMTPSSFRLVRGKRNVYIEEKVLIPSTSNVGEGVVLGSGTKIDPKNVTIGRSVVGRQCSIGAESIIIDSHLWSNVTIGENCVVRQALLANGVILKNGAEVGRGCILAAGVVVGENVKLPDFTRVSLTQVVDKGSESDDDEDWLGGKSSLSPQTESSPDLFQAMSDVSLGASGKGFVIVPPQSTSLDSDEEEGEEFNESGVGARLPKFDVLRASSMGCIEEEQQKRVRWRTMPPPDDDDDDSEGFSVEDEDALLTSFTRIVGDMVSSGFAEGHKSEDLTLEIKGLKFSQNRSFADCVRGIVQEMLAITLRVATTAAAAKAEGEASKNAVDVAFFTHLKKLFTSGGWGHSMLLPFIQESEDQQAVIETLENAATATVTGTGVEERGDGSGDGEDSSNLFRRFFSKIVAIMHDSELLTDEVLEDWVEERLSMQENEQIKQQQQQQQQQQHQQQQQQRLLRCLVLFKDATVQALVKWIQKPGEDSDEEDDDDDEEEE